MNVTKGFTVSVPHYKRVLTDDGNGTRLVDAPATLETVTISVDFDKLLNQLGVRAAKSKSGKAIESRGAIVVKHRRLS